MRDTVEPLRDGQGEARQSMADKTVQLGVVAAAAGCCALCAARSRVLAPEPLVSDASHRHPQFPELPTLERAQRTRVVRVPGFLSSADIDAIHQAAKDDGEGGPQLVRIHELFLRLQ